MICLKCGFENPDGAIFCNCCGAEMNRQPIDEQLLCDEQPEEIMDAASEEQESAFQLNMAGVQPKKSSIGIILAILGVVLAGAVLAMMLIPACKAFVIRTFRSPDKLLYTVYSDHAEDALADMDEISFGQEDSAVKTDAHILLGDQVISLAATAMYAQPEDLQALSDIGISCVSDSQDNLKKMLLTLSLSGTDIVDAEYYADQANAKAYIAFPQLQEQAILIDAGEAMGEDFDIMIQNLSEYDLDEELLKTLIRRYMKIYFEGFESVEKSSKTLQLQGVSQKVTVLEAVMTEKALYQVMVEILETMKTDAEMKQLVESLEPFMEDSGYEDFLEMLDEMISDLNSEIEDISFDNEYIVKTYINGRNSIVGAGLTYMEGEDTTEAFSYITLKDGRNLAHKVVGDEDLVIEGSGTYDKEYTGNFSIWYQGNEVMAVKAEGLVRNEQGLAGKITLIPTKDTISGILENMGLDSAMVQAANLMDISVEVIYGSGENGDTTKISLMAGSSMLVGVTYSAEPCQSEPITLPENYISVEDTENMSLWTENMWTAGAEKIMDNLEEAGLSEVLLAFAAMMVQ